MEPGFTPAKRPPKVDAGMPVAVDVCYVDYRTKDDHPHIHVPDVAGRISDPVGVEGSDATKKKNPSTKDSSFFVHLQGLEPWTP